MSKETKSEEPKVVQEIPSQRGVVEDFKGGKLKNYIREMVEIIVENSPPEPVQKQTQSLQLKPSPSSSLLDFIAAIPLCILVLKISLYGTASVLYQMPIPYSYVDSLSWIPAIIITGLFADFIWLVTEIKLKLERRTKPELITGWVLLILAGTFAYYFFLYIYFVGWFYPEIFTLAVALFLFICRKGYFYLFEALLSEAQ